MGGTFSIRHSGFHMGNTCELISRNTENYNQVGIAAGAEHDSEARQGQGSFNLLPRFNRL